MLVGDGDRERAAATLREQYASGRLSLDDLTSRTHDVLTARSREDLRRALRGLPQLPSLGDVVHTAARGAALVVFTGAYLVFSLLLLLVLALTVVLHGASDATLLGFLVVWLVPTYLLSRLWRRTPPRRRPGV